MKYEYLAFVVDIYDGDTFKAVVNYGFRATQQHTFRLFGVDTPEMRGEERERGIVVRDYVRGLMLNKEITIITHKDKTGKYGRYLAEVKCKNGSGGEIDLADHLLEKEMAVEMRIR